ncbi:MAG: hypothetical protein EBR82_09725 [Caulobacteraceae bacterium]|nr:hypothetical protein [Caulobacteraceae bacterium]
MDKQLISGDAEAAVLRDVERLADVLYAECAGSGSIPERRQVGDVMALAIAERSTPDGLALAFDRGQRAEIRLLALDTVLDKLLGLPEMRAYGARLDEQIRRENEAAEEQHRRDLQAQFARVMHMPAFPELKRVEVTDGV